MNATRLWTFGAVVVIAAILVLGWLIGAAPLLQQAGAADSDRTAVETQNLAQRAALETMKADFERLDEVQAELAELQASVPAEEQADYFARGVEQAALRHGVRPTSVVVGELPFLGGATGEEPLALSGTGGVATSTPAGTVYALPVTIGLEGTGLDIMATLRDLQALPRLFLVTGVTVTSAEVDGELPTGTISGYIFILTDRALAPTPEDAAAATTPENTSNYEVPDLNEALPEWLGGEGTAPSTVTGGGATPTPTPTGTSAPAP